uniref:DUF1618 domain-containing protein n=2 Tax=Oryza glaberrima TaxID=4538 RepID=I1NNC2_ORYGL
MSSCEAASLEGLQPRMPSAVKRARIRRESHPGWVMLDCRVRDMSGDDDLGAITVAKGTTSTGDGITVAFSAAAPPAISRLLFALHPNKNRQTSDSESDEGGTLDKGDPSAKFGGLKDARVIAAHGNSVLLSCIFNVRDPITPYVASLREELFIYQPAGAVDLTRLPPCYHGVINIDGSRNTGILCRNNGEFVVAHLGGMTSVGDGGSGLPIPRPVAAELCKYVGGFWGTNWLRIGHAAGEDQDLCWWETDLVVPFGDSLCWVDYLRGILFCDVFSPIPEFRYVRLPVNPYPGSYDQELAMRGSLHMFRSVCVTKNGDMKFVDVASKNFWFSGNLKSCSTPFTITSWTLTRSRRNQLSWIKDASLDADAFFSLANNEHLPSIVPTFPLVDWEDPNVIYFALSQKQGSNFKATLVAVNMQRKTLGVQNSYTLRLTLEHGDGDSTTSCNLFSNEPFLPFAYNR